MSAAASKSTVLAACTATLVAMVVLAGVAGAGKRDRTPPSPPVDVHVTEATPSVVYIEWTPAVDDVAVAGYYVFRDVGRTSVSRPSYTVTSLRCGESAPIWVQAYDSSGNRSERAEAIVSTAPCPDTTPPTTPSGFRQDVTTEEAVVLSWTPSSDASGVVGYGVYEGVTKIASTSEPTVTLDGLRCDTSYQYGFDAVDGAGNRSQIALVFVQTAECPDGQAPSAPTGVTVTARTPTSISLSWLPASDNLAVVGYEILVDGSVASDVEMTSATLSGLACATSYRLGVRALDAAGNRSSAATVTSSTDTCPAAPAPPNDTTAPTTPTGLSVTKSTAASISMSWTPSTDNVSVAGYGVYVNEQSVALTTETSFTVSGLTCGTAYSLAVDAYDEAGNRSTRATVTASTAACADGQAPSAPTNVAATSRTATSITLSWSASSDNVGVAGYGLYRAGSLVATASGTSGVFANLTCNTSYTLSVDAYDAAGNRSSKTSVLVSTTACSDTAAPSTPTGLAVSNVAQTSLVLGWNASTDNVGVTGYDLYLGGSKLGSAQGTTYTFGALTCGTSYTLGVVAYDAAGNRSNQASVTGSTSACSAPPPAPAPPPPSSPSFPSSFYSGPAGGANILPQQQGVFVGTAQSGSYASVEQQLADLEASIGRKVDIEHRFLQAASGCPALDSNLVAAIVGRGHIPMISWVPGPSNGGQILRGEADACLRQFGQQVAAQSHNLLLRVYWEFNGTWASWSKDTDGSLLTDQEHLAMWRRTVDQLRAGGAFPKASIVWCPAEGYYGNGDSFDERNAYPGDSYVDWVCSDDYNGNGGGWCGFHAGWCEFAEIFTHGRCVGPAGVYGVSCNPAQVPIGVEVDFRGRKPYLVGETGSKEGSAGQKGEWFRKARDYIESYMPGVLAFVYFDVEYSDGDWRIGTSDSSRQGFRDLASDSYFNTR